MITLGSERFFFGLLPLLNPALQRPHLAARRHHIPYNRFIDHSAAGFGTCPPHSARGLGFDGVAFRSHFMVMIY